MAARLRILFGRLAVAAVFFILVITLLGATEPRKRSYSCRTLTSCLGGNWRPAPYPHPLPTDPVVVEHEETLHDGALCFTREMRNGSAVESGPQNSVLFLLLSRDATSWSKDFRSTSRTVYDFLDLLVSTGLDLSTVSVGLMTASRTEFDTVKQATSTLPFARATVLFREEDGPKIPYNERHQNALQRERRGFIATLRNYLMLRTLRDEEHTIWVDADVTEFSPGIVQTMIGHANTREEVGVMTAICRQNRLKNYDKNAWNVNKQELDLWGPVPLDKHDEMALKNDETKVFVEELIEGTSDNDLVPVDSVGGTILYIRSRLIRLGVNFPPFNVVGTTWTQDGWDGVETEGLCYMARHIKGGRCFVLGGQHHIRHTDRG